MQMDKLYARFGRAWSLWAVLIIAAVWLFQTPYQASNLDVTPDSVEYAVGALQLLDTGHYSIPIQGRSLPPRYPPWFSALILLPAYVVFGEAPGNAILPVTLLAVAGIGFAWAIGRRIGGTTCAVLSSLTVLTIPTYSAWGIKVMTDVPCAALFLASALLYLHLRSQTRSSTFFLAGVLVALAMLLRPVFAALLLPFMFAALRTGRQRIRAFALLLLPSVAAAIATVAYNATTFGSPFRNGYHFWTAVPSDYPWLTFSLAYAPPTLFGLLQTALPYFLALSIAGWFFVRKSQKAAFVEAHRPFQDLAVFVILTAAPITLFHIVYFFPTDRFHLPLMVGTAVLAASFVGLWVGERHARIWKLCLPVILVLAVVGRYTIGEPAPNRRLAADRIRALTPLDSIIISKIEPVYLDRLAARNSDRLIVPLSRRVEYASKVLVRKRIDHPEPPPRHYGDVRAEGLLRGGAEEAVPFVASEQLETLVEMATGGRPVFLESSTHVGPADAEIVDQLQRRFVFTERAPNLHQLQPRAAEKR